MIKNNHSAIATMRKAGGARRGFPWSGITLSFLMITTFLIFATTGANGAETVASWTSHVAEVIAGTAIFSLASVLMVWAGRLLPRNF